MTVRWTRPAQRDFDAYLVYLHERDPGISQSAESDIRSRVELLGKRPGIGREARWLGLHEFSLTRWRKIIVYRIVRDGVVIIAFYDARQDLAKAKPRR
jgi:plasmid stabilization system protein ParE